MKNSIDGIIPACTCCFTGHRKIPYEDSEWLKKRIHQAIVYCCSNGITTFIAGGALGFDTLAAAAVIEEKERHPEIMLVLALPCRDQTKFWAEEDRSVYAFIEKKADRVMLLSEQYYSGCMQVRNKFMVDNSAYCVCYLKETYGGTYDTVKYAKYEGLRVFNIAIRKR